MPGRLERFLAAVDLDDAASLALDRTELDGEEEAQVRRTLAANVDPLGRRNLLLHPETLPSDLVVPVLVAGLDSDDERLVLAAVVGSHRAGAGMAAADRAMVTTR